MITINIPPRDSEQFKIGDIPPALQKAVSKTLQQYPTITNDNEDKNFDRLFENLYNCYIKYYDNQEISQIVWPDDRDYTVFLLQWA